MTPNIHLGDLLGLRFSLQADFPLNSPSLLKDLPNSRCQSPPTAREYQTSVNTFYQINGIDITSEFMS